MNTTPTTAPATGSSTPGEAPAEPRQPTAPRGEPFIPPDAQTPAAPVAPTPSSSSDVPRVPVDPERAPATDTGSDDSGGSGVPWRLGLLVPAVLLGGVGVGALARQRKKPEEAVAEFGRVCADLCWLKTQEAQAEADADAAQRQLAMIDESWQKARDYLRTQLRSDYVDQQRRIALASTPFWVGGGPFMWAGTLVHFARTYGAPANWPIGTRYWNAEVNEALVSGQVRIDGMRNDAVRTWKDKLAEARWHQQQATDGRFAAEAKLVSMRAQRPDVTFPDCNCL
jgi:hypothetical protein